MFYQLIGRIDSPTTPKGIDAYYRKFLQAPVQAYRNLGIDAEFKPVNDIQAGGKKVSGNGAGDLGDLASADSRQELLDGLHAVLVELRNSHRQLLPLRLLDVGNVPQPTLA